MKMRTRLSRAEREAMFGYVYENNQWGRSPGGRKYYSDSPPELTEPYRRYVSAFIQDHAIRRVVDLGCGDFVLASEIDMGDAHYTGVDIYPPLIEDDRTRFGDERHEFLVRDLVEDELPDGDLCLVSMVLYLMCHADVLAVLPKLQKYRYALITDGQAAIAPAERRNIDKPTGKYTPRDYYDNGFYLELPPFNLNLEVVCEYQIPSGEILRTVLIEP
jgi:SAM-dependent methyltransferase